MIEYLHSKSKTICKLSRLLGTKGNLILLMLTSSASRMIFLHNFEGYLTVNVVSPQSDNKTNKLLLACAIQEQFAFLTDDEVFCIHAYFLPTTRLGQGIELHPVRT
jgi:hypothetical protein